MTEKFDFEASMKRLDEISRMMNGSDITLENSMKLYSEAITLGKQCREYIDNAKITVENLEGKKLEVE